ncbi:site-2 protease family protein [Candidatus Woesearchaeota archaeon]|nr:site-2 protease family protein [Candidatus Woesearchaeota archaeon]
MNYDLLFAIIFYGILYLLFLKYRSRFDIQGKIFVMLRTKIGLKLMDNIAKRCPRLLKYLGYFGILICFIGMGFIFYYLIKGTLDLMFKPDVIPILSPVLPGVEVPGLPIVMSFWHWIIGILIVAGIHEFSHGLYARLARIKIKSSGIAFLGPILAAFVEPDEKEMKNISVRKQLSIMMGGPFSNFLSGAVFFLILILILDPLAGNMVEYNGVKIISINEELPINSSGLKIGDEITYIDNYPIFNQKDFVSVLDTKKPGDVIEVETLDGFNEVELVARERNQSEALMGLSVTYSSIDIKDGKNKILAYILLWLVELFFWLYVISFGIGLFNLLPLGPLDGGRMFMIVIKNYIKQENIGNIIIKTMTWFCLVLIFINLLPFIWKLLNWLLGGIVFIFGI